MEEAGNDLGRDKENKKKTHHTYRMLQKVGQGNFGTAFKAQS